MNGAAGVVLAGGRSSRMGRSKAALEWHGSTLLYRTAALLGRTLGGPVVVVRAAGQALPPVPDGVSVVDDPVPGLGPLQGIGAGLAAVAARAPRAFVCATDLPFLHPAFVRRVLAGLGAADRAVDVALPVARGHRQPLAAAYRTGLAETVTALLAAGQRRPGMLFATCRVAELGEDVLLADPELARRDPALDSVTNVNEPGEYAAARARPGPAVDVTGPGGTRRCAAATLAAAAEAAGVDLRATADARVNGVAVPRDPCFPLVAGDEVGFLL